MICVRVKVVAWVAHIVRGEGYAGKGGEVGLVVALPLYNSCQ
jgi:hypothetical protein